MANTAAAKKAMRASARRAVRNRSAKSAVKTRIARVRRALTTGGAEGVAELVTAAVSSLDRAAAKKIVHPNNAARRKSRLAKRVNAVLAGVEIAEPAKGTRRGAAAAAKATGGKGTGGKAKSTAAKSGAAKASSAKKPAARAKKS